MQKEDSLCMEVAMNYSFIFTVWGGLKEAKKKNLMSYNLSTKGHFYICLHSLKRQAKVYATYLYGSHGSNLKESQHPESHGYESCEPVRCQCILTLSLLRYMLKQNKAGTLNSQGVMVSAGM